MPTSTYANPHPDIGTELVREWEPDGDPTAYIVLVHGLAEHSGRYERTASLLAQAGFWVRGFDLIGAGGSGGRRWDVDDWSRYHDQIGAHVAWAREQGPPVILMGHSMGGSLSLGYALSDRADPDLLVLSSPAIAPSKGWQRILGWLGAAAFPRLAVPNPFPAHLISRDPAVVEAYENDPLVVPRSTLRLLSALMGEAEDLRERASSLDIPTLVFHGGDDRIVPAEASGILADVDGVDRKVYPGLLHETLNEPEGPEVVADVVDWLNAHL